MSPRPLHATPFPERLCERVRSLGTRLCVGVDPILEDLPEALHPARDPGLALERYACELIEATADLAAAVKLQAAHFERLGAPGWAALREAVGLARERGVPVIVDAKRGDIGSTARAYAAALVGEEGLDADAVTLSPYLGRDAVDPFLARPGKAVFVLVRNSNPSAARLQQLVLADGRRVFEAVLDEALSWEPVEAGAWGRIGLVAGATDPADLAAVRARAPGRWLLVPGVGAQGGTAADGVAAFDAEGQGALIAASRSIGFAFRQDPEGSWQEAAERAARRLRDEIEAALEGRGRADGEGAS